MIPSQDAVLFVFRTLNEIGAPYILTGSLATNLYAPPRATQDADFVVEMNSGQLDQLFERLRSRLDHQAQMSFETVTGKIQHKFQVRESAFIIEIFEAQLDDPHERARFERRRKGDVEGQDAFVPTAEDVIVQKLRWYKQIRRVKDREDIRMVLLHQWDSLDWSYIERWCAEHGTRELLDELKRDVEETLRTLGDELV